MIKLQNVNVIELERRFTAVLRISLYCIAAFLFVSFLHFSYKELYSNDFFVKSFDVPEEFEKNGYKSQVIIHKMTMKISEMTKQIINVVIKLIWRFNIFLTKIYFFNFSNSGYNFLRTKEGIVSKNTGFFTLLGI